MSENETSLLSKINISSIFTSYKILYSPSPQKKQKKTKKHKRKRKKKSQYFTQDSRLSLKEQKGLLFKPSFYE